MAQGKIVQCIGAVVDVEFPRNEMPKIYDALKLAGSPLTLEVQQQLGDGVVRTIALGSSDGLRRGLVVSNTGNPITVPVGKATLGRIMDVLGNPIDERGPVDQTLTASIHRKAPTYDELSPSQELLETGIKVIDLICPFAKGGKVGLFGGAGVGKTVNMMELTRACRCSRASANAPARATTSTTRCPTPRSWCRRTCPSPRSRWSMAR